MKSQNVCKPSVKHVLQLVPIYFAGSTRKVLFCVLLDPKSIRFVRFFPRVVHRNRRIVYYLTWGFRAQSSPRAAPLAVCSRRTNNANQPGFPVESKCNFEDFDILIGCSAIAHGWTLVTGNLRHLQRLDGIRLECWCGWQTPYFLSAVELRKSASICAWSM